MSFQAPNRLPVKCPRCKAGVSFADVVQNTLACHTKPGNASRVVLEPCFCQATSLDTDFRDMLQTVDYFNAGCLVTLTATS